MEKDQMSWDFTCKEYEMFENENWDINKPFIFVFYFQQKNNFSFFFFYKVLEAHKSTFKF